MTFYKTVDVIIEHKCWHIHKIDGIVHRDFTKDYGDIPTGRFNEITGRFEECVNRRGKAYAARNRKKFRKRNKK